MIIIYVEALPLAPEGLPFPGLPDPEVSEPCKTQTRDEQQT